MCHHVDRGIAYEEAEEHAEREEAEVHVEYNPVERADRDAKDRPTPDGEPTPRRLVPNADD